MWSLPLYGSSIFLWAVPFRGPSSASSVSGYYFGLFGGCVAPTPRRCTAGMCSYGRQSHLYVIFLSCAAYGLLPFITDLPQMPKCGPNLTSRIRSTLHSRRLHYVVPTCTKFCRRLGPLLTLSITLPCLILCALQATNPHRSYDHMRISCRRGVSAPIFLVQYTIACFAPPAFLLPEKTRSFFYHVPVAISQAQMSNDLSNSLGISANFTSPTPIVLSCPYAGERDQGEL